MGSCLDVTTVSGLQGDIKPNAWEASFLELLCAWNKQHLLQQSSLFIEFEFEFSCPTEIRSVFTKVIKNRISLHNFSIELLDLQ